MIVIIPVPSEGFAHQPGYYMSTFCAVLGNFIAGLVGQLATAMSQESTGDEISSGLHFLQFAIIVSISGGKRGTVCFVYSPIQPSMALCRLVNASKHLQTYGSSFIQKLPEVFLKESKRFKIYSMHTKGY